MATQAYIAGWTIKIGDGATPTEAFTEIEEAFSLSGLGKTNDLVEATHFLSGGVREYISGLADGQEMSIECNYNPAHTVQQALIADINAKTQRNVEVETTDGTTTSTFAMITAPLSWVINPAVDDRNTLTFTLKISGDITVTTV